jgi:hypothetical protein
MAICPESSEEKVYLKNHDRTILSKCNQEYILFCLEKVQKYGQPPKQKTPQVDSQPPTIKVKDLSTSISPLLSDRPKIGAPALIDPKTHKPIFADYPTQPPSKLRSPHFQPRFTNPLEEARWKLEAVKAEGNKRLIEEETKAKQAKSAQEEQYKLNEERRQAENKASNEERARMLAKLEKKHAQEKAANDLVNAAEWKKLDEQRDEAHRKMQDEFQKKTPEEQQRFLKALKVINPKGNYDWLNNSPDKEKLTQ